VLTLAAGVTQRIRLGTSVLIAPWYEPIVLARSLTTLDHLSDGRLTVGLGVGRSTEERAAVGRPGSPASRLDDTLDVLEVLWGTAEGPHKGPGGRIDPSQVALRPLQRPRPPLLVGGSSHAAQRRAGLRADGWNPRDVPARRLGPIFADIRAHADAAGRDPDALRLVVRADFGLAPKDLPTSRAPYHGSLAQVLADLGEVREAGAHEVILGVGGDPGLDESLDAYARLAEGLGA
jgi:alkanesulfonate monooxygenase SsuD/methylene tetrahydromethanopterin reductase-like flavin-dependent oxidoreductase (luciferase family)